MNLKKIGFISFALVLVLGCLGVGYAAYQQTLHIGATVTAAAIGNVHFADIDVGQPDEYGEYVSVDSSLSDTLAVTLHNAYPGSTRNIYFKIVNDGTFPVALSALRYSLDNIHWTDWGGQSVTIITSGETDFITADTWGAYPVIPHYHPAGNLEHYDAITLQLHVADVGGSIGSGTSGTLYIKYVFDQYPPELPIPTY